MGKDSKTDTGTYEKVPKKPIEEGVRHTDTSVRGLRDFSSEFLSVTSAELLTIHRTTSRGKSLVPWFSTNPKVYGSRLPISMTSVPGYVAQTMSPVHISDLYDRKTVKECYPELENEHARDREMRHRTKAVIGLPIKAGDRIVGVVEVINCLRRSSGHAFTDKDVAVAKRLADCLVQVVQVASEEDDFHVGPPASMLFAPLVRRGVVSQKRLDQLELIAADRQVSVASLLISDLGLPFAEIASCLESYYQVPVATYNATFPLDVDLLDELGRDRLRSERWMPLFRSSELTVVLIDDPLDEERMAEIPAVLGVPSCEFRVALIEDINQYLEAKPTDLQVALEEPDKDLEDLVADWVAEDDGRSIYLSETTQLVDQSAPHVVRIVSKTIVEAIRRGASDIHIEPGEEHAPTAVRMRVDGICTDVLQVPVSHTRAIVSRIKVMSNLDITEKRLPQDGKMTVRLRDQTHELRVASLPTVNGECIVMRLLSGGNVYQLSQLGLSERNMSLLLEHLAHPHGLFLVVGPTGSGKTTSLHAVLAKINDRKRKIWTAEDPVEITQPGLQQVQVNPQIGLTFATCLRAFLRADPDVILIGEMRDYETAHAGIEASLTGHLVFSTLHTNSAPETITRLLDMKLDAISFADALVGVLAQRLVRRLCPACKVSYRATPDEVKALVDGYGAKYFSELGVDKDDIKLWQPVGCEECLDTGYKGRLAVHELLSASKGVKAAVLRGDSAEKIREIAVSEGMRTLRQDGIAKVLLHGETDITQVWVATTA